MCLQAVTCSTAARGAFWTYAWLNSRHLWSVSRQRDMKHLTSPAVLFVHLVRQHSDAGNTRKIVGRVGFSQQLFFHDSHYQLFAVAVHHGVSFRRGHYTAFGRHQGRWLHLDDGKDGIAYCTAEEALDCDAYILGYQKEDQTPSALQRRDDNEPSLSASDSESDAALQPSPAKRPRTCMHRRRIRVQTSRTPRAKKNGEVLSVQHINQTLERYGFSRPTAQLTECQHPRQ